jgi:activator of HSP90 ATPase
MTFKFTRFIALISAALFVQVLVLAQEKQRSLPDHPGPIHQEVDFTASPERIYEVLLDSVQFKTFSGRPADIDRAVGGAFSLFGGPIVGRNVELVPNQRIVQAWRVANWLAGVYSIAKFELVPQGSGTHLVFDHVGFPEDQREHLAAGWKSNYWDPLTKYFH